MDPQLKGRMRELGEAINESLSDSGRISEVISHIKEDGYDPFLVLEATVGVSKKGGKTSDGTSSVSTFSMGTSELERLTGKMVKVLRKLLSLGIQMCAVVEVENDFVIVSVESLELCSDRQPAQYPN
jgi:hypothetical protein